MSDVTKRTVTTTRHEYVIPSGSAYSELIAAIDWARKDMPEARRGYDDACYVEARDEEIVVWWPEQASGSTS